MKFVKCPNCKIYIDEKIIRTGIKYKWPFITKFKCPECSTKLKQTWYSMLYAWFVFGFLVYVTLYKDKYWIIVAILLFLSLFLLGYLGKVIVRDLDDDA